MFDLFMRQLTTLAVVTEITPEVLQLKQKLELLARDPNARLWFDDTLRMATVATAQAPR